ncbi:hypothetical protein FB451DRAFT_181775 [Mycena latifolia]|nr:hypothetical protein FB451DRAFT_181775 [Mycena latifolia]
MWPTPEEIEHLVNKSSGVFIYATTVIRFIEDEYSHPADRLTLVLSLDPRSTAPLDDLYTEILSVVPCEPQQLHILHAIWQGTTDENLTMDPEQIDSLLDLCPGTSRLALRGLHSLFNIPPIRARFDGRDFVRPLHASLGDYLEDSRRSGKWCVSTPRLASDYLHSVVRSLSSLQVTLGTRLFHRNLVKGLPQLLSGIAPTDTLVTLMRNDQFQDYLFLIVDLRGSWPKEYSGYPLDLIQLWEDHDWISDLTNSLKLTGNHTRPSGKFDAIYRDILSRYPTLLFVLKLQIIQPSTLYIIMDFLQCNYQVLQPFLPLHRLLELPFLDGDSPLDFLNDQRRAGNLYSDPQDIAEDLVLLWIQYVKKCLIEGYMWLWTSYLDLLEKCQPSPRILHALESLDIAQICDPRHINPADHYRLHAGIFSPPRDLHYILEWLQKFPDPPLQAIAFWEKQKTIIQQCQYRHRTLAC